MKIEPIQLGQVMCDFISPAAWTQFCDHAFSHGAYHHLVTLNPEMVLLAENNQLFQQAVASADLRVPDGAGLIWARWYLRSPYWFLLPSLAAFLRQPVERITGVDAVTHLAKICQEKKRPLYVVGGQIQHVQQALKIIQQKFPGLITRVSPRHEYSAEKVSQEVLHDISQIRPAVVMVAYGAPEQTLWLEKQRSSLAAAGVIIGIGVGGAFDILSESLPRAPIKLRVMNLEWLWRLYLEPKRLPRIYNAIWRFPRLIKKYKARD